MPIEITTDVIMKPRKDKSFAFDIYDRDGNVMDREAFQARFAKEIAEEAGDPTAFLTPRAKVCAEGDSWLNILWPVSKILGHEKTLFDVIQKSGRYETLDLAWPGDTLKEVVAKESYRVPLSSGQFENFIFSAAGNDVIGSGALVGFLKERADIDPAKPVETWLNKTNYKSVQRFIEKSYMDVAKKTEVWSSGRTKMLIHGYDYPIPQMDGEWFGEPLDQLGYDLVTDKRTIEDLIRFLIDDLYSLLGRVEAANANVVVINCRNIVNGRWNDELHPEEEASRDLAKLFMNEMTPTG